MRCLALTLLPVFALSFSTTQSEIPAHEATIPAARTGRQMERHELINSRILENKPDIIFIGDSITAGWERAGAEAWEASYRPRKAANLGIGGDRTQHVLWRLENGNVDGISPKLAVVMIGTNNSRANTPEQTRDGIIAIVRELRRDLPNTKILLLGIFPRGENAEDERRQTNSRVNTMVAGLADGDMVHYLDIGAAFLESDGSLSREIMPDLLHLSEEGYGIWAEAMEPVLIRLIRR